MILKIRKIKMLFFILFASLPDEVDLRRRKLVANLINSDSEERHH